MARLGRDPVVLNQTLTSANTEYTITIPSDAKKFIIQARQDSELRFSYVKGQSGGTYMTIYEGSSYPEDSINISGSGLNIYVQSPDSGTIVEVLYWRTT